MDYLGKGCILYFIICIVIGGAYWAYSGISDGYNDIRREMLNSKFKDALKTQDFEKAHEVLKDIREKYIHENYDKEIGRTYFTAFDQIYKAEIQYILSELEDTKCKDRIMFLLDEIPVDGEKYPEGICDYNVASRGSWTDDGLSLDAYINWTQHYNMLCNSILTLAINRENQGLAKQILLQFVDNVDVTTGGRGVWVDGVSVDGNHGYIKYTRDDFNAAKKKYDEAVESGEFNSVIK